MALRFTALRRGRLGLERALFPPIHRLALVSSASALCGVDQRSNGVQSRMCHLTFYHSLDELWGNVPAASRLASWRPVFGAARFLTTGKVVHPPQERVAESDGTEDVRELAPDVEREPLTLEAIEEAAEIGYKVVGRIKPADIGRSKPPKAFAVVQVGSHQFKISPGDCIYTEKLKYADVNDKLCLDKVLLLGSRSQTIIGRPVIPKASVHAVVEEQVLDAKVIIFKKKRRKNYRRTNGHRQELTRLRILDIRGLGEARSATI